MEVKGKPLSPNRTNALTLYVSLYHYLIITGIKCSYCQGSKNLHFANSSAYVNLAELWKHVVMSQNYGEDAECFRPTTEMFNIFDSKD